MYNWKYILPVCIAINWWYLYDSEVLCVVENEEFGRVKNITEETKVLCIKL